MLYNLMRLSMYENFYQHSVTWNLIRFQLSLLCYTTQNWNIWIWSTTSFSFYDLWFSREKDNAKCYTTYLVSLVSVRTQIFMWQGDLSRLITFIVVNLVFTSTHRKFDLSKKKIVKLYSNNLQLEHEEGSENWSQ